MVETSIPVVTVTVLLVIALLFIIWMLHEEIKSYHTALMEGKKNSDDDKEMTRRLAFLIKHEWIIVKTDDTGLRFWIVQSGDETAKRTINEAYERQTLINRAIELNVPLGFLACKLKGQLK